MACLDVGFNSFLVLTVMLSSPLFTSVRMTWLPSNTRHLSFASSMSKAATPYRVDY